MSLRANPTLIGAFVLGGALLAVIAAVAFGSGQFLRDTQTFVSFFSGSVAGLDVGSAVRFRGIQIGSVNEILLDLPAVQRDSSDLRIAVVYDLDRGLVESRGASVRVEDPLDINELLRLGIRAELAIESLVTGRRYIALDLDPDNPIPLEPVLGIPYPEIPTRSTGLERIQEEVLRVVADLSLVRLDSLIRVATDAFREVASFAASPELASAMDGVPETLGILNETAVNLQALFIRVDSTTGLMADGILETTQQANATLQQLDTTLASAVVTLEDMGSVLAPRSPVLIQFQRAMDDLSGASRAMSALADYLERNPSALIRGKPPGGNW